MKHSIRVKLFMGIGSIIIFFVFLLWILNTQYLEKYYIVQKKNMLIKTSEKINSIYDDNNLEEMELELERLEHTIGAKIVILDKNGQIKYNLFNKMPGSEGLGPRFHNRSSHEEPLLVMNNMQKEYDVHYDQDGKFIFQIKKDMRLKIDFLVLETVLKNEDILILRIPLAEISESVDIANRFMMYIATLSIIVGSIWAFIFSRRFTKPILEISDITENMAKLDFTQKCRITDNDELGQLGKNINYLSNELDNAISELHIKNQKLKEDIERERKIDEMRKEFVSSVSHELKTPISLIQGYAEGLKENVIEDEENKNFYCEVIIDEANKMNTLVKDLLNLSQIESGYFRLEKTNFDISSLIDNILYKYKGIFEEKKVNLKVEKEEIMVYADKIRVDQILVNFINNAINHIDVNKKMYISIKEKKEKVRICVFNSGKHIPNEELEKIWSSFYKVDKARTREYGGYGLGLSIVRAIQELDNNEFGVENVDNGVRFWFELNKTI